MLSRRSSTCALAAFALAFVPAAAANAEPNGELAFAESSPLAFVTTTIGSSISQKVTLKNSSMTDSVTINGLSLTGPDANEFAILSPCGSMVGPGSSCEADISYSPMHAGTSQAQLAVDNDGLNQGLTRDLTGDGVASNLSLSSTSVDFGTVWINDGGPGYWVGVQNDGPAPTRVDQVEITGPDASAFWIEGSNCQGQTLPQNGGGCSFNVRFNPQEGRSYDATLRVRAPGSDFTASLTGVGGVSDATLAPATVEFGSVDVGRSTTATVTMTSSGNVPYVPFVTIFNGGDVGSFRIVKDGCSLQVLDPTDQCELTLRFAPFEAGAVEATLAVLGDGNPKVVKARGVGLDPGVSASHPGDPGRFDDAGAHGATAADGRPAARVTFTGARRHTARYTSGWAYLGRVRCEGAPTCRVTVRTQYVVTFGDDARPYLVRGRAKTWTVGSGRRLWAPLPRNLRGTPARVLVTLETDAAGHSTGVQYRNLRLVPARR